jgi:Fe2+ or Zn2+ uptake regulation protein
VKEAVYRLGCHPSADTVYEEVRKAMPGISLGTVYRNLRLLSEAGEIAAVDGAGAACRYDACVDDHYHFRCERCGSLIDVNLPIDHNLDTRVQQLTGLSVRCHVIEFRGLCDACQRTRASNSAGQNDDEMVSPGQFAP